MVGFRRILFWAGLAIVVITHISIAVSGTLELVVPHAILNLVAAGMIIIGKNKKRMDGMITRWLVN